MASSTGGKGSKKKGRGLRSPSHNRYNVDDRRTKNKIKKISKQKKQEEKKQIKKLRYKEKTDDTN